MADAEVVAKLSQMELQDIPPEHREDELRRRAKQSGQKIQIGDLVMFPNGYVRTPKPANVDEEAWAKETAILEQFEEAVEKAGLQVPEHMHNDRIYRKYIRARKLDLQAAVDMFTACLKWRVDYRVDTIDEWIRKENKNFDLINNYFPLSMHNKDKRGMPIVFEDLGGLDVKGFFSAIPESDFMSWRVWIMEQHHANVARTIRDTIARDGNADKCDPPQVVAVIDIGLLGISHYHPPGLKVLKSVNHILEHYYPEGLFKLFIINARPIFTGLWNIINRWLDPHIKAKVQILGADYLPTILEFIDIEQVPAQLGGQCKCNAYREGLCFPNGGVFEDKSDDGTSVNPVQLEVGRRDARDVCITVKAAGKILSWDFTVESNDINFIVFYQPQEGEEEKGEAEEVLAGQRVEGKQKGELECKRPGTYTLRFDNSYSTFRSKTLTYLVKLTTPPPPSDGDAQVSEEVLAAAAAAVEE
jgi:hypothetical protein